MSRALDQPDVAGLLLLVQAVDAGEHALEDRLQEWVRAVERLVQALDRDDDGNDRVDGLDAVEVVGFADQGHVADDFPGTHRGELPALAVDSVEHARPAGLDEIGLVRRIARADQQLAGAEGLAIVDARR